MGSLTGKIRNTVGDSLVTALFPDLPVVVLVPTDEAVLEDDEVRVGGKPITLDGAGAFTLNDVPDGEYRVQVTYFDPPSGAVLTTRTAPFQVDGDTQLAAALGMALLTGPEVLVIALDTDGQPYYVPAGTGTHSVHIDTDGQPYYDDPPGGEDVYSDADGVPVILTLA